MLIPRYWADCRLAGSVPRGGRNRPAVVRRSGWSDESQAAAERHAAERAAEALAQVAAGQGIRRLEPRDAYDEAVPIREEVVARHGDAVVTRNGYGARCLNVPNVLFADLDLGEPLTGTMWAAVGAGLLAGWGALAWCGFRPLALAGFAALGLILWPFAALGLHRLWTKLRGGDEAIARRRARRLAAATPNGQWRLYRTPAGFRVLALHRLFDPLEPATQEVFAALRCDPRYAALCRRQRCFRARVGAKPWRIGVGPHIKTTAPGWPPTPGQAVLRNLWVAKYEAAADRHAACAYLETLGDGPADPVARAVQELHDLLSRATSGLPIA